MTFVGVIIPASQMPILVTASGIHYFSNSCQKKKKKKKPTWTISYSKKALMNFRHDAPNSHVPAINPLEFLVHALSITSYDSRQRVCKACL